MKEPFSWQRAVRFFKRNDTLFYFAGLFVFGHVFWWQVQQNKAFISTAERRRHLGPIPIVYLDEIDYFKKKQAPDQNSGDKSAPGKWVLGSNRPRRHRNWLIPRFTSEFGNTRFCALLACPFFRSALCRIVPSGPKFLPEIVWIRKAFKFYVFIDHVGENQLF